MEDVDLKTRWLHLATLSSQINPTNGLTAAADAFPPAVPGITHPPTHAGARDFRACPVTYPGPFDFDMHDLR